MKFVVPLVLALAALLAWRQSEAADVDVTLAEPIGAAETITPVLSARRLPDHIASPVASSRLSTQLASWVADSEPGTCVVVADRGRPLLAHRPAEPLVPASTEKIITALAALNSYDDDDVLETLAVVDSDIDPDGLLKGDLWVVGGGDPLLATQAYAESFPYDAPRSPLELLADSIVAAGIQTVDGRLLADESLFDEERYVDSWPDRFISQGQSGPISALTVDDGFAEYPERFNEARPIPAEEPALNAISVLEDLLTERGVAVRGGVDVAPAPPGTTVIAAVPSLPMSEIVAQMLTYSDNMTAEMLLKLVGTTSTDSGTTAAGAARAEALLETLGLPTTGVDVVDGSGLDPGNALTCQILVAALDRVGPESALAEGLAVAGETGTLSERYEGSPARGRVRAKTGSLNAVTSLAGFVATEPGAELSFATITNLTPDSNRSIDEERLRQEELTELMLTYPDVPAREILGPVPPQGLVLRDDPLDAIEAGNDNRSAAPTSTATQEQPTASSPPPEQG